LRFLFQFNSGFKRNKNGFKEFQVNLGSLVLNTFIIGMKINKFSTTTFNKAIMCLTKQNKL